MSLARLRHSGGSMQRVSFSSHLSRSIAKSVARLSLVVIFACAPVLVACSMGRSGRSQPRFSQLNLRWTYEEKQPTRLEIRVSVSSASELKFDPILRLVVPSAGIEYFMQLHDVDNVRTADFPHSLSSIVGMPGTLQGVMHEDESNTGLFAAYLTTDEMLYGSSQLTRTQVEVLLVDKSGVVDKIAATIPSLGTEVTVPAGSVPITGGVVGGLKSTATPEPLSLTPEGNKGEIPDTADTGSLLYIAYDRPENNFRPNPDGLETWEYSKVHPQEMRIELLDLASGAKQVLARERGIVGMALSQSRDKLAYMAYSVALGNPEQADVYTLKVYNFATGATQESPAAYMAWAGYPVWVQNDTGIAFLWSKAPGEPNTLPVDPTNPRNGNTRIEVLRYPVPGVESEDWGDLDIDRYGAMSWRPAPDGGSGGSLVVAGTSSPWGSSALSQDLFQFNSEPNLAVSQLTDLATGLQALGPAWSNSGSKLAFAVGSGGTSSEAPQYSIWLSDKSGATPRPLVLGSSYSNYDPAWTPDDGGILYTRFGSDPGSNPSSVNEDIWLIDLDTHKNEQLTDTPDVFESHPILLDRGVSPEGQGVVPSEMCSDIDPRWEEVHITAPGWGEVVYDPEVMVTWDPVPGATSYSLNLELRSAADPTGFIGMSEYYVDDPSAIVGLSCYWKISEDYDCPGYAEEELGQGGVLIEGTVLAQGTAFSLGDSPKGSVCLTLMQK